MDTPEPVNTTMPNVMLVGDSISANGSGYYLNVKQMLEPTGLASILVYHMCRSYGMVEVLVVQRQADAPVARSCNVRQILHGQPLSQNKFWPASFLGIYM